MHRSFTFLSMTLVVVLVALSTYVNAWKHAHPSAKHPSRPDRDTTFEACDKTPEDSQLTKFGVGLHWQTSDDANFYLAPGLGACGQNYTDQSNVVCVKPGWIHSGNVDHCNSWVQVTLPETGVTVQGIVWDACGALENTTFGCNDIYLSKHMFRQLAGNQKDAAVDAGRLPGQAMWRFIPTPCWGCWAGLPGMYPNGTQDTCQGLDQQGFLRCGNVTGDNRVVFPAVDEVCNTDINSCTEAGNLATTKLPHLMSNQSAFNQPGPVVTNTTSSHPTRKRRR